MESAAEHKNKVTETMSTEQRKDTDQYEINNNKGK
jgi:hypothetical protein